MARQARRKEEIKEPLISPEQEKINLLEDKLRVLKESNEKLISEKHELLRKLDSVTKK